jgi:hypothetical protein
VPQASTGSTYLDGLMLVGDDGTWPSPAGSRSAVPLALTDESLLWTTPGEAPPAAAPASWDEVEAVTRDAAAAGRAGWCLGLEGAADGIGDLLGVFEDGLLGIGGVDVYDAWGAGDQLDAEAARRAFTRTQQVADPSLVYRGIDSAQHTPPAWAAWPMFAEPSPCVYHPGGGQDRIEWPTGGVDALTAVAVPGGGPTTAGPVRGRVYVVAILHDRPETRAVLRAMLDPLAGRALEGPLAQAGLWRPGSPTGPMPDRELIAAALRDGAFRVRLIDMVPAPVSDAMAEGLAAYTWAGDSSYPLFAGGVRQAWARLPIDGGG